MAWVPTSGSALTCHDTGVSDDRPGHHAGDLAGELVACAGFHADIPFKSRENARRVRDSDFGRRFTAGTWPNLPLADLDLAAQIVQHDLFRRRQAGEQRCQRGEHSTAAG